MALVKPKQGGNYHVDIIVPEALRARLGKSRIRESTGTPDKQLAQRVHDNIRAAMWRQDKLGEAPDATLGQAIKLWEQRAKLHKLRAADDVLYRLEWWREQLGDDRILATITRRDVMAAVAGKQTTPKNSREKPRPATSATINRYLQAMRGLLRLCAGEWELIKAAPTITLLPEPRGRVRALTREEVQRLLAELPPHLRNPLLMALATGLRKENVVRLEWSKVDLERRRLLVGSEDFKNGNDFGLPLNQLALDILAAEKGKHPARVFTYEGKPLGDIQHRTWSAALERAGIADFRWHDLRHTWATMLVEAGTDLDTLQKLGGWESREMVMRYAHFRTAYLHGAASKIDTVLGGLSARPGVEGQETPAAP